MAVKLSIVMPVFNNRDLVVEMWRSIIDNEFVDWELLAIDDGSDDDCYSSLSTFASNDKRVRYFRRKSDVKGAQSCRNEGLSLATGEFVIFFDSDDIITTSCLGTRVKSLDERKDVDFMVFPSGVIRDNVFSDKEDEFAFGYPVYGDDYNAFARRTLPFIVWNNIYRTERLREKDIRWDERLLSLQDADFNLQCMFSGMTYDYYRGKDTTRSYSAKADIGYRIDGNAGSVSKKAVSTRHRDSVIYAIDKFFVMYHKAFAHRYDYALYKGVLFLYNWMQSDGIDAEFSGRMADVVYKHSAVYGCLLKCQVLASKMLRLFVPAKRARQIPMLIHLVDSRRRVRKKCDDIRSLIR